MSTSSADQSRYGFIGMIVSNRQDHGARINQILSTHASVILGRLGMPNLQEGEIAIITLIVKATPDEMGALTGKLGALEGVSVKSSMHKAMPLVTTGG